MAGRPVTAGEKNRLVELATLAIQSAQEQGSPVAGHPELMAPTAIRRWQSSARRGVDQKDIHTRIKDLAKGLAEKMETHEVGPLIRDYEFVSELIARTISADNVKLLTSSVPRLA